MRKYGLQDYIRDAESEAKERRQKQEAELREYRRLRADWVKRDMAEQE